MQRHLPDPISDIEVLGILPKNSVPNFDNHSGRMLWGHKSR